MGRGRQKAKQTKIARKLKYLTTDTDYDELAKELSHHDDDDANFEAVSEEPVESVETGDLQESADVTESTDEDLDDYAAWAAQAAKRAEAKPAVSPVKHKPFPKIPMPGIKPKN
ncbi:DUF3073 domain-containing protein [Alloscardovia criceti]|uniref:DUF3073 domain-containing protein n=1 Tax=Alloscardovia criceti TaxID=356828 RepID=UPI00036EB230|nr:DUF3073 domain-containing protein [Alloscardovia criceti]